MKLHRSQASRVQTGSDLVSPCFTRILAKLLWWLVGGDPNEPCGTATQMSFSAPISYVTQCMRVSFLAGSIKVYTKKTDGQHFTIPTPQRDTSLCGATRPRANLPYNWRLKKFLNFKSWTNQEAKQRKTGLWFHYVSVVFHKFHAIQKQSTGDHPVIENKAGLHAWTCGLRPSASIFDGSISCII